MNPFGTYLLLMKGYWRTSDGAVRIKGWIRQENSLGTTILDQNLAQ